MGDSNFFRQNFSRQKTLFQAWKENRKKKLSVFAALLEKENLFSARQQYKHEMTLEELEKQKFTKMSSSTYIKRTPYGSMIYSLDTADKDGHVFKRTR